MEFDASFELKYSKSKFLLF